MDALGSTIYAAAAPGVHSWVTFASSHHASIHDQKPSSALPRLLLSLFAFTMPSYCSPPHFGTAAAPFRLVPQQPPPR